MDLGYIHIAVEIALFVLGVMLSVISWLSRDRTRKAEESIAGLEGRVRQVEVQQSGTVVELRQVVDAIAAVGELRSEIALRFMTREDMAAMMHRVDETREMLASLREDVARIGPSRPRRKGA